MAELVLVGYGLLFAICVLWRSWLQHRRTGDWGFRLRTKGVTVPEWGGVLAMTVGCALSALIPALQVSGVIEREAVSFTLLPGLLALACGLALTVLAQLQMGASWRIGVQHDEQTALVTAGVFSVVRNPIYSGLMLVPISAALLVPDRLMWLGALLVGLGLEIQVRWVEEPYLIRTHGAVFEAYARRVGRFVPRLGRMS